jgi:hypothetical protein
MSRKKIKPRGSRRWVTKFNLAREVHYIQRRAAGRDGRFVTVGELAFFSGETGDAWVLDPSDRLAAQSGPCPPKRFFALASAASANQFR